MKRYALTFILGGLCFLMLAATGDYLYPGKVGPVDITNAQAKSIVQAFKDAGAWTGPKRHGRHCVLRHQKGAAQSTAICRGLLGVADPADLPHEGQEAPE